MDKNVFEKVSKIFYENGMDLYKVGGAVRDRFLGIDSKDDDYVTSGDLNKIVSLFERVNTSFIKYGVLTINIDGHLLDITHLRKEYYENSSRKPTKIEFVDTLIEDSYRRDFTINAIYQDKDNNIYDYHNGLNDLKSKIIRCIGNPEVRFNEDPLRMLRCIRFSYALEFSIEEKALKFIKNNLNLLKRVSVSIINCEIEKIKELGKDKYYKIIEEFELDKYIVLNRYKSKKTIINLNPLVFENIDIKNIDPLKNKLFNVENFLDNQILLQVVKLKKSQIVDFVRMINENSNHFHLVKNIKDINYCKSVCKIGIILCSEEKDELVSIIKVNDYEVNSLLNLYQAGYQLYFEDIDINILDKLLLLEIKGIINNKDISYLTQSRIEKIKEKGWIVIADYNNKHIFSLIEKLVSIKCYEVLLIGRDLSSKNDKVKKMNNLKDSIANKLYCQNYLNFIK